MDEARTTRQLSLSRNLGLAMTFLALMGWGTAYFARASTAVQQQLRGEVAQLKVTQDQLLAERDQARAQLAAAQQEGMVLTKLWKRARTRRLSRAAFHPPCQPATRRAPQPKPKARVDRPPRPVQAPELSCHTRGTAHRR